MSAEPFVDTNIWVYAHVKNRYGFSYWDSLVVASALEAGFGILYSDDLQHEQRIERSLRVVNPFLIASPSESSEDVGRTPPANDQ
jgi:predicted nucleic acid-binding protein